MPPLFTRTALSLSLALALWAAGARAEPQRILFFGDSLTAGYGIETSQAFPALIQQRLDRLGWPYVAVNAGLSGETSAAGLRRIDWVLRQPVDVLVLELGANDGLRGVPLAQTRVNLQAIVDRTRAKYPEAALVVAGMQIPPNLGPEYTEEFRRIFPELAEHNDAALIPFLLEGVGGLPEFNLPDGIHPTPEGHAILADNVWRVLEPLLQKRRPAPTAAADSAGTQPPASP